MRCGLTVPATDTTESLIESTPTPILKGRSGGDSVPPLNLDVDGKDTRETPLITASPYAQNEGLTFPRGTCLWQPQASTKIAPLRPTQAPAIITESSFDTNENLKIPSGTSLWQPSSSTATKQQTSAPGIWNPSTATSSKINSGASLSMRRMKAPLPASNLITQSPYDANEDLWIPSGTPLWQPNAAAATKAQNTTGKVSLITQSPYALNDTVSFSKGTLLWQPKA